MLLGDDHDKIEMSVTANEATCEWKEIDRNLRAIASKRSALDAEEARWLREADRVQIFRVMGFSSMLAYLEHALGYTPRVALDRLRVARELATLPLLTEALERNQLCYSALRELTRVATAETEHEWRDVALDKTVDAITAMVAGHARGDRPSDPPDPALIMAYVRLELLPEILARFREVRAELDRRAGRRLEDSAVMAELCEAVLSAVGGDCDGRARYQIALTVCETCRAGTQDGGGITVSVLPSTVARAECDAQRIGSIDPATGVPARAKQDIPPKTQRFVWRRDHGRCQVPGCRSGRFLEVHHIVPREAGGSHDALNLLLLCDRCHASIHEGAMTLSGTAPSALTFARPNVPRAHVSTSVPAPGSRFDQAVRREEIKQILVANGFERQQAAKAADRALAEVGAEATTEAYVRAAFRACNAFVGA